MARIITDVWRQATAAKPPAQAARRGPHDAHARLPCDDPFVHQGIEDDVDRSEKAHPSLTERAFNLIREEAPT